MAENAERLDRIYHTQDQLLKLMSAQATDAHALRQDVGEIKDTLIGTLENPGGLAGHIRKLTEGQEDHETRIISLEESRVAVLPVVAAHKERKKDFSTLKAAVITVVGSAVAGAALAKLTGIIP
jgi:hypothetical protein